MSNFIQYCITGLTLGMIYALIAIGFSLIYRVTNIINFAQGEFVMLGGMLMIQFVHFFKFNYFIAVLITLIIIAIISIILEKLSLVPFKDSPVLIKIIFTIGASIFIRGLAMIIFWKEPGLRYETFFQDKYFNIFGIVITLQDIFIISSTIIIFGLIFLLMEISTIGKAMRACAVNIKAANIIGINVPLMLTISFVLSGIIGGLAGIIITPKLGMSYNTGVFWGIKGFTAAILGGIDSNVSILFGGILLGLLEAFITGYGSNFSFGLFSTEYKDVFIFLLLILLLIVRPNGIFRKKGLAERV